MKTNSKYWIISTIATVILAGVAFVFSYEPPLFGKAEPVIPDLEYVTAPENNTYKVGVKNFQEEFKDLDREKPLQYKLDDKFISFNPKSIKWDNEEIRGVQNVTKLGKEYKEVFGTGIDLKMKSGERIWKKLIIINSLKDLGTIPKDTEYLEVEFEVETNFIIDGWNKHSDFEVTEKVRLGDFSYIEPAMAWDSYNETICEDQEICEDVCDIDCVSDEDGCDVCECEMQEICENHNNRTQIKGYFKKNGSGKLIYVKQIPVDWLESAQYPVWTDADVTYGTASEFDDGGASNLVVATVNTDKFTVCHYDTDSTNDGECRPASVSGTTITWGVMDSFNTDVTCGGNQIDATKLDSDKFVVVYCGDTLADDGYARSATIDWETDSGTISWGTEKEIETSDLEYPACAQLDTDKFIAAYNDETNSDQGTGIVCSDSSGTISCGTEEVFESQINNTNCEPDGTDKFVCAYRDAGDSSYGKAVAGTTSGGTDITWGTINTFDGTGSSYAGGPDGLAYIDTDKLVMNWLQSAKWDGYAIAMTLSGTTISYGASTTVDSGGTWNIGSAGIDSTHYILGYGDIDDSYTGKSNYNSIDWGTSAITLGDQETWGDGTEYDVGIDLLSSNKIILCYTEDLGYCMVGDTAAAAPAAAKDTPATESIYIEDW